MVTIWQEEQHISLAVGSIPATPREMGVLHGCHTVKFDSRNNLWSCVHTLTFSCAALLWVWINTGKIIIIALLWQISKHGTLKTVLSWYNCFVDALKYPIDKFALVKHCCYIYCTDMDCSYCALEMGRGSVACFMMMMMMIVKWDKNADRPFQKFSLHGTTCITSNISFVYNFCFVDL